MRCQTLRSVLRGLLAVGFLATAQHALLHASWKDRLQPHAATCFVHDIHWETSNVSVPAIGVKLAPQSDFDDQAAAKENELCLAAAKEFEFQMQFQAAWETFITTRGQFAGFGKRLFRDSLNARELLVVSVEQGAIKLAQWIKVSESLPVTALVSQDDTCFGEEWNCGDWGKAPVNSTPASVVRLPQRSGGNIFVYAIEAAQESALSDSPSFCDVEPTEFVARSNAWQIGVDPVCSEVNERNAPISWRDSLMQTSVCCPIGSDLEAVGTQIDQGLVVSPQRPPVLEAEFEGHECEVVISEQRPVASICDAEMRSIQTATIPSSPYAIEEQYERKSQIALGNASPMIDSVGVTDWTGWMSKRFEARSLSSNRPELRSRHTQFSLEDLILPSKTQSWIFDALKGSFSFDSNESSTPNVVPLPIAAEFLVNNATSEMTSLISQQKSYSTQSNAIQAQSVSKYVANRIRNFGLFLIDFASQMELQAEQVEIARQETHQR